MAGYKRSARTNTHRPQPPRQEWWGAAETRAQAHTPTPHTPARGGGAQTKPEPKHTRPHPTPQPRVAGYKRSAHTNAHTPTPRPGVAGRSRNLGTSTHTNTAHPSQEWQVQAERAHKHTQTATSQPGLAGRSRNPSPSTHAPTAHPSQEWRGTSEVRTQAHTHPNTPAGSGGAQPKTEPEHTHAHHTSQPGVAGYKRRGHTSTHMPLHPSLELRGAAETRAQAHTPTPHTPARSGGVQEERTRKHTHTPSPQPGVAGCSRNPSPSTTKTQTQAPHKSRKHSVHSPGTEAARAMQVTRPNEIRRPGVRLHPKACAALRLEAERATPWNPSTKNMHACLGNGIRQEVR